MQRLIVRLISREEGKHTIDQSPLPLLIAELLAVEQSPQQQDPRDPQLQQRQPLILRDLLHKPTPPVQRPFFRPTKIQPILLRQIPAELDHALDNPSRIAHDVLRPMPRGRIQRIDDIRLNLRYGMRELEMLTEIVGLVTTFTRGARGVGVGRGDAERPAEEDGGASIVHEDDSPEADPELRFLLREDLRLRIGVVAHCLQSGIVVQTELDGEAHEAAYETPEGAALALQESQIVVIATRVRLDQPPYTSTSAARSGPGDCSRSP